MISVEDFGARARKWLADNLERRQGERRLLRGVDRYSKESVIPERARQRAIWEAGFGGITWPVEYGGQGLTADHERAFYREAAGYRLPDLGILGGTTNGVCAPTMLRHASPDFLRRHGPRILAGDELFVQFFSEPGAGSDLAGVTTRAERDGDRWILNGSKIWSSGAYYADWGMCLARTDWDAPKHRGLTWFAVPCDAKGLTIQPIREINGDAEFCQEFFDDVEVPDDERIGEVNKGWTVTQTMLVFERGAGRPDGEMPATGPGPLAADLVELARRLGRTDDPHVRQLIAEAHTNDFAQRQLARRVAGLLKESNGTNSGVAAYGKLAAGTFGPIRGRMSIEIGGAGAVVWERGDREGMTTSINYLNSRVQSIAGGTNEVQRNGIAERVLGLPREPAFDIHKPFREVVRDAGSANWANPA